MQLLTSFPDEDYLPKWKITGTETTTDFNQVGVLILHIILDIILLTLASVHLTLNAWLSCYH